MCIKLEKNVEIFFKFKTVSIVYYSKENTDTNNNNKEEESKTKYLEARRRATGAFHEWNKTMKYINKNKEIIQNE